MRFAFPMFLTHSAFYDFLNASCRLSFKTNPGNLFPRHFLQTPVERDCITFLEKAKDCMPVNCILDQCGLTRGGGGGWGVVGVVCVCVRVWCEG